MYYASVGDAAFLDSIGDAVSSAADDVISSAKSEGQKIVSDAVAFVAPSSAPAPRAGLSSRVASVSRRAPSFVAAPLPSVSSEPTPLGAAPFRAPSRMVGPSLTVVPAFQPPATPTFMASAEQAAPSQGMSGTTMLVIGAAVLGGLYLFSRK